MSGNDKNIFIHAPTITPGDRATRSGHKGCVVWFTGLSGSGKSTIAHQIEAELFALGANTYVLDGDNVRYGLNSDLGFSPEDRNENIRRIGEVAKLLADAGMIALVGFISPYRKDRDSVREKMEDGQFFEVFVDCPLEVCEARDTKGLYKRARAGEISEFTGINAPYEPPLTPEVRVDTSVESLGECSRKVLDALGNGAIITNLKEGG